MKTIIYSLIFLFIQPVFLVAQNQLDETGKKHGKWTVYLDENWNEVKDSSDAIFYRYTIYDNGTNLYPMGPCGKKGWKLEATNINSKILNGEYKWFDEKGRLSSEHILKNGEYVSCKEYYPSGELQQHFDYTQPCENEIYGWTLFVYDKKGTRTLRSPFCKENGKWPITR